MISNIKRRYSAYRLVLVGSDFHSEGGAWRSVYSFYKRMEESGESVLLVDLRRKDGWRQWFCAVILSPRIVVNGMAAMTQWRVLLGLSLRKDVAIYLHDTDYMLNQLNHDRPWTYRCILRMLRDRPVLCVSEQMAAQYRKRFAARNATVVYEVTELDPEPVLEDGKVHIVMAGSLNRRKGYPLFVEVAKLAIAADLPWKFHWVGGLGDRDLAPVSEAITWWGWRNSPAAIVRQAGAFFLSSVDDPQPLACLEALALGKRVVVYAGTGSAELVNGLPGCRVFADHEPESALQALMDGMSEKPDPERNKRVLRRCSDVNAFRKRLDDAFES